LEDELAAPTTSPEARSLSDWWAAVGLVILLGVLLVAGALPIRRRRPPKIVVPDTIEELEPAQSEHPTILG
jgi:hypothetical protein